MWGNSVPGKGNSPHNGPEAESSLVSSGRGKRLVWPRFRESGLELRRKGRQRSDDTGPGRPRSGLWEGLSGGGEGRIYLRLVQGYPACRVTNRLGVMG